jgi:hypothetical protein
MLFVGDEKYAVRKTKAKIVLKMPKIVYKYKNPCRKH